MSFFSLLSHRSKGGFCPLSLPETVRSPMDPPRCSGTTGWKALPRTDGHDRLANELRAIRESWQRLRRLGGEAAGESARNNEEITSACVTQSRTWMTHWAVRKLACFSARIGKRFPHDTYKLRQSLPAPGVCPEPRTLLAERIRL